MDNTLVTRNELIGTMVGTDNHYLWICVWKIPIHISQTDTVHKNLLGGQVLMYQLWLTRQQTRLQNRQSSIQTFSYFNNICGAMHLYAGRYPLLALNTMQKYLCPVVQLWFQSEEGTEPSPCIVHLKTDSSSSVEM